MIKKEIVRIFLARPLSKDLQMRVEKFISKRHEAKQQQVESSYQLDSVTNLEFEYEIDNSILGGILIIYGSKYFDATLKHQLIEMRKSLK
ncbi:MAG: F0F1 ATP synthase subunit delta [Clostridiales bacterium]|jgi:F0F1-type ATP synthase delta subunit|nr:F0F1 ATP synthase subunit delta [Clostridiales bacterium]